MAPQPKNPGYGSANIIKSNKLSEEIKPENYVITITPKDQNTTHSLMRENFKKNIKPANIKVRIKNVKNISKNGILIQCTTKNEIEIIKNEVQNKLKDSVEVKIPTKKRPRIIIYNISKELSESQVIDYLVKQNPNIET